LSLLVVAGGCATQSATSSRPVSESQAPVSSSLGKDAVQVALRQVGTPYRYGGAAPGGFDCSGLVHYSYLKAGKSVPRTTSQLWNATATVERRKIRAGDLLFFNIDGKMSHVGLYIGGSRFVHAPSSGKKVSVESLESDFYRHAFIRAGRPQ
jgi:cell wall-associated NlpC family hydrolase